MASRLRGSTSRTAKSKTGDESVLQLRGAPSQELFRPPFPVWARQRYLVLERCPVRLAVWRSGSQQAAERAPARSETRSLMPEWERFRPAYSKGAAQS